MAAGKSSSERDPRTPIRHSETDCHRSLCQLSGASDDRGRERHNRWPAIGSCLDSGAEIVGWKGTQQCPSQ